MLNEKFLDEAIEESKKNQKNNFKEGGPFGAVIVKNGQIISKAHNLVISNNDPTAHAEINAIRQACSKLKTHDLSDCILYTNAEPCPMCLSAIIWANIKEVYFANTAEQTNKIGFRDELIYDFIKKNNTSLINMHHIKSNKAEKVFDDFEKITEKLMY